MDTMQLWYVCVWFVHRGGPERVRAWKCHGTRSEARARYRELRGSNFDGEIPVGAEITYNATATRCPRSAVVVVRKDMQDWLREALRSAS